MTKQEKLEKLICDLYAPQRLNVYFDHKGVSKAILASGICDVKLPEKKELLPDLTMIHVSDAGIISLQNHDIGFNKCLEIVKELNK